MCTTSLAHSHTATHTYRAVSCVVTESSSISFVGKSEEVLQLRAERRYGEEWANPAAKIKRNNKTQVRERDTHRHANKHRDVQTNTQHGKVSQTRKLAEETKKKTIREDISEGEEASKGKKSGAKNTYQAREERHNHNGLCHLMGKSET